MAGNGLKFELIIPRDPALFERDHRRALRLAFTEAAVFHHERHIPRHFEPFASVKYRYARRNAKYEARKQRLLGHRLPLVFTGKTRDTVTMLRTIRATPKGATLTMRLPIRGGTGRLMDASARARLIRAGKRVKPLTDRAINNQRVILQLMAEIEVISPDEMQAIRQQIADRYTERAAFIKDVENRSRKRIAIG